MKKLTLIFSSLFILTGCSLFNNEKKNIIQTDSTAASSSEVAQTNETATADNSNNAENNAGVFNESELSTTDYPKSTLDESISAQDLNSEIVAFYNKQMEDDVKQTNSKPAESRTMEQLQFSLENNTVLKDLQAKADQVMITIDGHPNYVVRITVPMTFAEADKTIKDNDILLMNEALAQLGGQRLVQINYYDKANQTVTPMHLGNAHYSLFFNDKLVNN